MRILFALHGWPPEEAGGTELATRELARGLRAAGDEVVVLAGSLRRASGSAVELEETVDAATGLRVVRLHRPDLYFDHWHKSRSAAAAAAFRAVLREVRPDVVHVQHWLRLSRDLVANAAREGVPAVLALHDAFVACPALFRLRTDSGLACEDPVGANPCLRCVGRLAPRTPWVDLAGGHMRLAERQRDLLRELELARVVAVPSAAHGANLARWLELGRGGLAFEVLPPAPLDLAGPPESGPAPLPPPAEHGKLVLACWGTLAPHKGQDLLVDAVLSWSAALPVELHLAGSDGDAAFAQRLRARVQSASGAQSTSGTSGGAVIFHGPYAAASLAEHPAARAHAFVSATRAAESHGLALDEALALGLPVVAPRQAVFLERFGDEPAVRCFDLADPGSLSEALRGLAELEPQRYADLRLAARAAAQRAQCRAAGPERWRGLYERALALGAPAVPAVEWFEERLDAEAVAAWDRALGEHDAAALGIQDV